MRTHVRHTPRGFDRDNQGLTRAFTRYPVKLDQGGCQTSSLPGSDDLRDFGLGVSTLACVIAGRARTIVNPTITDTGGFSPQKKDSVIRRRESRSATRD